MGDRRSRRPDNHQSRDEFGRSSRPPRGGRDRFHDAPHRDRDAPDRSRYRSRSRSRDRRGRGGGDRSRSPDRQHRSKNNNSNRDRNRDRDRDRDREWERDSKHGSGGNGRSRDDHVSKRGEKTSRRHEDRDNRGRSRSPARAPGSSDLLPTRTRSAAQAIDGEEAEAKEEEDGGVDGVRGNANNTGTRRAAAADDDDDEVDDDNDDDEVAAMQAMMGFGGFGTTKGKKVAGNNAGAVHKEKKTEYRQYMNRQGGFNRPLSPQRR